MSSLVLRLAPHAKFESIFILHWYLFLLPSIFLVFHILICHKHFLLLHTLWLPTIFALLLFTILPILLKWGSCRLQNVHLKPGLHWHSLQLFRKSPNSLLIWYTPNWIKSSIILVTFQLRWSFVPLRKCLQMTIISCWQSQGLLLLLQRKKRTEKLN